ncbi:MAG: DUF362 domain-containing protein [Actinobacteria bacterium]|nr:DUF362 domain-containing protein [Actinomycetota bacterium]
MRKSKVAIVRTGRGPGEAEISRAVREAVRLAGGLDGLFKPGDTVLIKPNLVAVPKVRGSGAITNPLVCKALADIVKEHGGRPIIAESSAAGVDTEKVIQFEGYAELREQGYEVIDLKRTPLVTISIPNGVVVKEVRTFEPVVKAAAIISVPVMKTHDQTEATLSLKNLKGLESDADKKHFHRVGISEGVADLASVLKPVMAIVDGIVGQEGLGPIFGHPVEMDLIVAGRDLVATDTVVGAIMGFEPHELQISVKAAERGLGTMGLDQIEVVGEEIDKVHRRFMRSSEDALIEVPDFKIVFKEGTCTGCHNTVLSAMVDMKNDGLLEHLRGKAVVAGLIEEGDLPKGMAPENLILVGRCVAQFRERGKYVPGCPPNNIWIVQGIVGEGVKRRYATEEIKD